MILAFAALVLYWDQPADTAPALQAASISHIAVSAGLENQWKDVEGISTEVADPETMVKLPVPGVEYHISEATATGVPWINGNGWRMERDPKKTYFYEAPGRAAALAAAETGAWGGDAYVHTDAEGLGWFAAVARVAAQNSFPDGKLVANIGLIDNGSDKVGEIANLLARYNLLFQFESKPDVSLPLNVRIGSPEYPEAEAADPHAMALHIRGDLGDDKRALRIYGSLVVIGQIVEAPGHLQLRLINYGSRPVHGLRVRVHGAFSHSRMAEAGVTDPKLIDYLVEKDATEFTIVLLDTYGVVDLTR